jgi:hypothetical protein
LEANFVALEVRFRAEKDLGGSPEVASASSSSSSPPSLSRPNTISLSSSAGFYINRSKRYYKLVKL